MTTSIIIDPSIQDRLLNNKWTDDSVGLIVGLYPENPKSPIQIIHLAQTSPTQDQSSQIIPTISTLPTSLLTHHTRQLLRMLPGGINLIGLYSICAKFSEPPTTLLKSFQKSITTKFANYQPQLGSGSPLVFLQFDYATKEFDVQVLDTTLNKTLNMEVTFSKINLLKVESDFDLSGVVVQQIVGAGKCFEVADGVDVVVQLWKDALSNITTLIDNKLPDAGEKYVETNTVAILVDQLPSHFLDKDKDRDFLNHLHLKGRMHLVAFVVLGESTLNVEKAIHIDFLRSLSSRLNMHIESLIEEDANIDAGSSLGKVYHELPRRVFVKLFKNRDILVSDYLFPGEGPRDCLEGFAEILGVDWISEEDIDEKEGVVDLDTNKGSMEELAESIGKMQEHQGSSGLMWGVAILAAVVAIVGMFLINKYF